MKTKAVYSILLILNSIVVNAQSIQNYAVIYEKKLNLENLYKGNSNYFYDADEKFFKEEFKMTTNSEKSLYKKIEQPDKMNENYMASYMTYSTTFLDIKNNTQISEKEVGEKTFLMKDSIPSFEWYIHDETKIIAGYTCIKAMAKFKDSIMLVAYFTDELEASIGPESVGGLPGTILGLVIPRLHTTWLAKSVEKLELNPPKDMVPPVKGKDIKSKELFELVKKAYADHPKVNSIVWRVIL